MYLSLMGSNNNSNQILQQIQMQTNPTSIMSSYPNLMSNPAYLNGYSTFGATSQPESLYALPHYQYLQQGSIYHQNNQGSLQPTYMFRNTTPDLIQGTGLNQPQYTTTVSQNYMQNPMGLGQQVNFMNSIPQNLYPSQYLNQQAVTGNTQTALDQTRAFNNQIYLNALNNGFGKTQGGENSFSQMDQLIQYQANQASNQSAQQQKLAQNQKPMQAAYQQQNQQQQFQVQQQSFNQQVQLPQQLQQAQNQQRSTQVPAQKQKQQTANSSTPLNQSQSASTAGLVIGSINNKQVAAQPISQSSSKTSKLGVSEISQNQKTSSNQGSSKSKSKSSGSNNNAVNLLQQQGGNMNSLGGINNFAFAQQNVRNGSATPNMKGVETEAIKSCICSSVHRLRNSQSELIQCKNKGCEQKLHLSCMKISAKDEESITQFECPSCILKKYDPLHHVEQVLVDCQAMMNMPTKSFEFALSSELFAKIRDNNEYCVEVRCIRIDGTKNIYETTWPDYGCLRMNNEIVLELKPLQNNSSLKKRKDEKHTFKGIKNLREGMNILNITEFNCNMMEKQQMRITESALHCISIFVIRRLTIEQLIQNIRKENTRPADECKQQIQNYFHRNNRKSSGEEDDDDEICIDSLSVPLTCSLDMKLIQTPAKGRYCKHFQCFSLENFIITTETVNPRKWRCNICKAKCYDIIVDEYILKIIQEINEKQIKNVTDVKFDGKGQYSFDQQSYSDDDDDYDDDSKPIVKKSQSTSNQNYAPNAAATAAPAVAIQPNQAPANPPQLTLLQPQLVASSSNSKGQPNGSNIPKGVNLDSHSNSNALEPQQQQAQGQAASKKPKQIVIDLESDEDIPEQKQKPPTQAFNQPIKQQMATVPVQQPYQQAQYQLQQQQQGQQPQQLINPQNIGAHHHHIIPPNNFTNGHNGTLPNMNIGIPNSNNSLAYNLINNNSNIASSNLQNAKSLNGLQMQNQQNASHQTSNTAGNIVNSQNITQMIPPINQDKGQSSNQSPKNIQSKSQKKYILTEDESNETSKLQNQINKNNNIQQKSIPPPSNHKEQKLNSEEVQRELSAVTYKKNNGNVPSSSTSLSSTINDLAQMKQQQQQQIQQQQQQQQQQQLQLQQKQQQNEQQQKQIQQQDPITQQTYQHIFQNALKQNENELKQQQQQQKQHQTLQINKKKIGGNHDQPILIESPKSDHLSSEISSQILQQQQFQQQQAKQQKTQIQQNAMKIVQIVQPSKENSRSGSNQLADFEKNDIGINFNKIQNPFQQQQQIQQQLYNSTQYQKQMEQQKMEEMSASGEHSKSCQNNVLSEKDIQNIDRKRLVCEQNLEKPTDKSFFDEFMYSKNQNKQTGQQDLPIKSKMNSIGSNHDSGNKSQQIAQSPKPVNGIIVQTQIQNIINYFSDLPLFPLSNLSSQEELQNDSVNDDDRYIEEEDEDEEEDVHEDGENSNTYIMQDFRRKSKQNLNRNMEYEEDSNTFEEAENSQNRIKKIYQKNFKQKSNKQFKKVQSQELKELEFESNSYDSNFKEKIGILIEKSREEKKIKSLNSSTSASSMNFSRKKEQDMNKKIMEVESENNKQPSSKKVLTKTIIID